MNQKYKQPQLLLILIVYWLTLPLMNCSYAGFHNFTMHSRANCAGFNESISWYWNHPQYLITFSQHTNPNASYSCDFHSGGWENTWRSAACHFVEGYGGWFVRGQHWGLNARQDPVKLANTEAVDCNIYDGWWDK